MVLPALKNYEICIFLCDSFKTDSNDIRTDTENQILLLTSQLSLLLDEYTEKKELKNLLKKTLFSNVGKPSGGYPIRHLVIRIFK